jgi:hypothetical protein
VASEVDICNLALLRIGSSKQLASLTEASTEGRACALLYPLKREQALASFPWAFATKREELALLSGGTTPQEEPRSGWAFVYALPADCLSPQYIWAGKRNPTPEQRPPFTTELASSGDGRVLLTDVEDAQLVYTAPVTTAVRFPPLFVEALAWLLASELALSLRKEPGLGRAALMQWQAALGAAGAQALREQQTDVAPDADFIRART